MIRISLAVGFGLVFVKSDYLQSHYSLAGLKLSRIFRDHSSAKRMGWSDQKPLDVPPAWTGRDQVGKRRIRRVELSLGDGLVVAREVGGQRCVSVRLNSEPSLVRVLRDLSRVAQMSGPFPSKSDAGVPAETPALESRDSSTSLLRGLFGFLRR